MNNSTYNSNSEKPEDFDNLIAILQHLLIIPECFSAFVLSLGIYGMYSGIEIRHPLYTILFINLLVPLFFTIVDLAAFPFISTEKFIVLTNTNHTLSLFFHCNSWCLTSILRYIYIVFNDWINQRVPNEKVLCAIACIFPFVSYSLLAVPPFCYAHYLGQYFLDSP